MGWADILAALGLIGGLVSLASFAGHVVLGGARRGDAAADRPLLTVRVPAAHDHIRRRLRRSVETPVLGIGVIVDREGPESRAFWRPRRLETHRPLAAPNAATVTLHAIHATADDSTPCLAPEVTSPRPPSEDDAQGPTATAWRRALQIALGPPTTLWQPAGSPHGRAGRGIDRAHIVAWAAAAGLLPPAVEQGARANPPNGVATPDDWAALIQGAVVADEDVTTSADLSMAARANTAPLLAWLRLRHALAAPSADASEPPWTPIETLLDTPHHAEPHKPSGAPTPSNDDHDDHQTMLHLNAAAAHLLGANGRARYVRLLAAAHHLRDARERLDDAAIAGHDPDLDTLWAAEWLHAHVLDALAELEGDPGRQQAARRLRRHMSRRQASGMEVDTAADDGAEPSLGGHGRPAPMEQLAAE